MKDNKQKIKQAEKESNIYSNGYSKGFEAGQESVKSLSHKAIWEEGYNKALQEAFVKGDKPIQEIIKQAKQETLQEVEELTEKISGGTDVEAMRKYLIRNIEKLKQQKSER